MQFETLCYKSYTIYNNMYSMQGIMYTYLKEIHVMPIEKVKPTYPSTNLSKIDHAFCKTTKMCYT